MSFFQEWRYRPRSRPLRKAIFQIHLWTGLLLGAYMLMMGLSGSVLMFADEIEGWLHPELFHAAEEAAPMFPLSKFYAAATANFPDRQVTAIYTPTAHRQAVVVYLRQKEEIVHAYYHPRTVSLLGTTSPATSTMRWLQDLHFNLLSGRTGRTVNGIGGLFLLLLCISGAVIWWPGVQTWLKALKVDWSRSFKRVTWDLHSAVGFWSLLVLCIWAISGFYFGYSAQIMPLVNRFSTLSQVEAPESLTSKGKRFRDLDRIVDTAQRSAPTEPLYGLQFPANPRAAYIVFLSRETPQEKRTCDYVYFDQYSGEHLRTWRRGISASTGDLLVNAMVPLHFGTFGGTGIRILWAILGLAPPVLLVTGLLMWWYRSGARALAQVNASK